MMLLTWQRVQGGGPLVDDYLWHRLLGELETLKGDQLGYLPSQDDG